MRRISLGRTAVLLAGVTAVRTLVRASRNFDMTGKSVLVTGGARGLGLSIAKSFARRGANVSVCSRSEADVSAAVEELGALGPAFGKVCDVTDRRQVTDLVRAVTARFGDVDVLVNNAGVITVGPLGATGDDEFEESIRTHLFGPLYCTRAVLPAMKERRSGRIVNISSVGGIVPIPRMSAYCTGKWALTGYSDALRVELAKYGVLVTTVWPGLLRTGGDANARFVGRHQMFDHWWFSLLSGTPGLSADAERTAEQIVTATARGDARLIPTIPAKAASFFYSTFPSFAVELLGAVGRVLPDGDSGPERRTGLEIDAAKDMENRVADGPGAGDIHH